MALVTPTTEQVASNIIGQLETAISQTIPLLPKAFSRVLAKVLAAVYIVLYKYAGFSLLQQFVTSASFEETEVNGELITPLIEWGRLVGSGDPLAATQAQLTLSVTVLNQIGSLPGGTQLLYSPTGVVYLTTAAVLLNASTVAVTALASSDPGDGSSEPGDGSGTIGNLSPGQVLQFANSPANVANNATVTGSAVVGADAEAEDVYRARVLRRCQRKPQGGAYADYQVWGTEVAGIRNVFPYTGLPGEVDVYVEAEAGPDGIPSSPQLAAVLAAIYFDPNEAPSPTGLANRRPANAAINVLPITRAAFDVDITGFTATDPATVLAAIEQGLDEFLRAREPYIVGLSSLPRLDRVTQGAVGGVVNEIAEANGATVASVTLRRGVTTIVQYTLAQGELAKLASLNSL
jgi:uncharacterized phage protein gp47/JayE